LRLGSVLVHRIRMAGLMLALPEAGGRQSE
jgi:hypothetical protein